MAENDIVRSLFGPTPNEVRQQNIANDNAAAHAYGMMTHQQRGAEGFNRAGAEIARGVAGLAGYVDPAEQRAQQEQAILSRYDTSTTEGMAQASQAAKAMGRYDLVAKIQQYHTGIQKQQDAHELTQSQIGKNEANAEKMLRVSEFKNNYSKEYNNVLGEANRLFPNDPAGKSKYITDHSEMFMKNPNVSWEKMVDANGREVMGFVNKLAQSTQQVGGSKPILKKRTIGVEGKPKLAQDQEYNAETSTWKNVGGEYERHGEGVHVNVDPGEKAFDVETGKLDAKAIAAARTSADAARLQKRSIKEMSNMNDNDLISGSFASSRVGLLNIFDTLGFSTMDESSKLASSQIFQKASGDLILSKIGALGYNPSNADLAFIQKILPQLESSPAARRELIHFMDVAADSVIENFTKMDAYARAHKSLGGYVPVQNTYTPLGNAPKITRQEAIEELARRNKK